MNQLNAFLNMMQSVDAFFPIGAFTLSNGLETYVQQEKIEDCMQLQQYITAYMQTFPYNDLGLMYFACLSAANEQEIMKLDQLCAAMKAASEIRNGSNKMCIRFIKAVEKMNVNAVYLNQYQKLIKSKDADGYHPIALGIYAADQKLQPDIALGMYGYSVLSAIVNNAVKLVPLSQMEGQRVLQENIPVILQAIDDVKQSDRGMLGISGCAYDIRCMQHERLYSRLYMS